MNRIISRNIIRSISQTTRQLAKNDTSTIDSFRLPSQTSINEWEFKYDFIPKVSEPKVPPISEQAIKQDIAQERKKKVEQEMLNQENASSLKVEANDATVVHGGEQVGAEPEFLHDRGSDPIKVQGFKNASKEGGFKPANRDQYVQSSTNPNLNQGEIHSLSESKVVDNAQQDVKQGQVVDDLEHDNLHNQGQDMKGNGSKNQFFVTLGIFGLGVGSYYYYDKSKTAKK